MVRAIALVLILTGAGAPCLGSGLNSIANPLEEHLDAVGPFLFKIEGDFDFDGINDVAIGDSAEFGNGGGPWSLYLGNEDHEYERLGVVSFSPSSFQLLRKKRGVGIIRGCWHMSAAECTPFEYEISGNGIAAIPKDRLNRNSDVYKRLGASLNYKVCEVEDLHEKHRCRWRRPR